MVSYNIGSGWNIGSGFTFTTSINVISAGLTIFLDASSTTSYPGSGSTWYDLSGNSNNATLYNSPTTDGKSIIFSGAGTAPALGTIGSVQYGQAPNGVYFNGDFTINTWIKISAYNNWARIIDFGNGAGNNSVLLASSYGATGYPGFYVTGSQFQSTQQLSYNTWYNVAATMSGTTGTIYVNGAAAGSQTMNTAVGVTRQYCFIGRSEWAGDGMYQGNIGSIAIYNRALSAGEMATNFSTLRSVYGV